jgi:hypothetical protein
MTADEIKILNEALKKELDKARKDAADADESADHWADQASRFARKLKNAIKMAKI